jgi:hypothetical protein
VDSGDGAFRANPVGPVQVSKSEVSKGKGERAAWCKNESSVESDVESERTKRTIEDESGWNAQKHGLTCKSNTTRKP